MLDPSRISSGALSGSPAGNVVIGYTARKAAGVTARDADSSVALGRHRSSPNHILGIGDNPGGPSSEAPYPLHRDCSIALFRRHSTPARAAAHKLSSTKQPYHTMPAPLHTQSPVRQSTNTVSTSNPNHPSNKPSIGSMLSPCPVRPNTSTGSGPGCGKGTSDPTTEQLVHIQLDPGIVDCPIEVMLRGIDTPTASQTSRRQKTVGRPPIERMGSCCSSPALAMDASQTFSEPSTQPQHSSAGMVFQGTVKKKTDNSKMLYRGTLFKRRSGEIGTMVNISKDEKSSIPLGRHRSCPTRPNAISLKTQMSSKHVAGLVFFGSANKEQRLRLNSKPPSQAQFSDARDEDNAESRNWKVAAVMEEERDDNLAMATTDLYNDIQMAQIMENEDQTANQKHIDCEKTQMTSITLQKIIDDAFGRVKSLAGQEGGIQSTPMATNRISTLSTRSDGSSTYGASDTSTATSTNDDELTITNSTPDRIYGTSSDESGGRSAMEDVTMNSQSLDLDTFHDHAPKVPSVVTAVISSIKKNAPSNGFQLPGTEQEKECMSAGTFDSLEHAYTDLSSLGEVQSNDAYNLNDAFGHFKEYLFSDINTIEAGSTFSTLVFQ